MVSILPQSKLMRKYPFLDGYNDVKRCRDERQAASNLVHKITAFADKCFLEELGSTSHKPSSPLLLGDSWPTLAEFNIFNIFPKIDTFMKHRYPWLNRWPHSVRHLNELIVSKDLSFHIFEVCYGVTRISYPVAQATFSVYFIFEINRLVDQGAECIVKYFLEGSDEELIPYVNDNITPSQVKALLKKKLAISSTINVGTAVKPQDDSIRNFIHVKKQMLKEFRFKANNEQSHETIPFPYTANIRMKKKCTYHGTNCPIFSANKSPIALRTALPETQSLSSGTLSSESSAGDSFCDTHDLIDPTDVVKTNKNKRRSCMGLAVRELSPGHYCYYDYDDDDDDDDHFVDNKKELDFDFEYDFDDSDSNDDDDK